jgi:hypothetical protein
MHLTYANVMATIAVFGVLGGGAYAASVAKNSVTSKSVKNGSIKGVDVLDDGLTGDDIVESTLQGIQGPKGDAGAPGTPGAPGAPGLPGTAATAAGGGNLPVATPDMFVSPTATLNAPAPGRVLAIYTSGDMDESNCDDGSPQAGLYVDSVPVPGTGFEIQSGGKPDTIFGVTAAVLPAGNHTVQLGLDCPNGVAEVTGFPTQGNVAGILVG